MKFLRSCQGFFKTCVILGLYGKVSHVSAGHLLMDQMPSLHSSFKDGPAARLIKMAINTVDV